MLAFGGMVLPSCSQSISGTIYFELEGGKFTDESFSASYLTGEAGQPVLIDIPDPVKDGYFFVGWREKTTDGSYRVINKRLYENGNSYYYYPYGSDTFYAYFEPLVTIDFDLTQGNSEGKLIAPKYQSEHFSDHTLSGYASKSIPSTDYLPTADATSQHLNFQYWYLKYPLISSTDENKTIHYSLDTSQAEGEYRFDKAFEGSMAFLLDSNITLYAKWEADPSITVHFNMAGFEDYTFQAKDTATEELMALMNEKFDIDYNVTADNYYYTNSNDSEKYRFHGFYLNAEFTQIFSLDSSIGEGNFDLYLRWDKEISITFNYNGGTLNGESSHTIDTGYYGGDILGNLVLDDYRPTKEYASFISYQLNGKKFSFDRDALPNEDIELVATYDEYPTLYLKYDYPTTLDDSLKEEDKEYRFALGESLSSALTSFKSALAAHQELTPVNFYILDSSNEVRDFTLTNMPDTNMTVYLKVNYTPIVHVATLANVTTDYETLADTDLDTGYQANYDFYFQSSFSQADLTNTTSLIKKSDATYLFNGFYYDSALTNKVTFPLALNSSHDSIPELTLYRKMTKAITLTFKEESTLATIGTLSVIPGGQTIDYASEIATLCGSYTSLIVNDGTSAVLGNILPSSDCEILVKR